MNANENKNIFQNGSSQKYVEIKLIGQGAFSNVFLVQEELSKKK